MFFLNAKELKVNSNQTSSTKAQIFLKLTSDNKTSCCARAGSFARSKAFKHVAQTLNPARSKIAWPGKVICIEWEAGDFLPTQESCCSALQNAVESIIFAAF